MSAMCSGAAGDRQYVLAQLLDLLDLARQLAGEGFLQRLQLNVLAMALCPQQNSAYLGLAGGVAAEAIEGGGPQRRGSAESA